MPTTATNPATRSATLPASRTVLLAEALVRNAEGLYPDRVLSLSVMRGPQLIVYSMRGGVHGSHSITEQSTSAAGGWARAVAHWEGYVCATQEAMDGTLIGDLGTEKFSARVVCAMLDRASAS